MYLIANLKAHAVDIESYVRKLESLKRCKVKIILAPPYPYLNEVCRSGFLTSSQDVSFCAEGAFTGEIPASLLKSLGVRYCLLGHSERRTLFHEDTEILKNKYDKCVQYGLEPVLCVGETKEEHNSGHYLEKIRNQVLEIFPSSTVAPLIAYEPIWSIGSGQIPEPSKIEQVVSVIKEALPSSVVLYGGSVNPSNAAGLATLCDGLLVGSASKDPETLTQIIQQLEKL
jgi:triosephosphate isomerase (TIM)